MKGLKRTIELIKTGRMGKWELTALVSLAVSVVLLAVGIAVLASQSSRAKNAAEDNASMKEAAARYDEISVRVKTQETRRGRSRPDMGTVAALEQVLGPYGLMPRMKAQRALPSTEASEERAEVSFEGLSMNEAVNLLYLVDSAQMLLIVRGMDMKTSFANPELMDLTLTVSLIKPSTK